MGLDWRNRARRYVACVLTLYTLHKRAHARRRPDGWIDSSRPTLPIKTRRSTFYKADAPVPASIQNDYDPEALAQLAQVLAHRLRGLVAGIEGYTDLLADSLMSRDQRELALKIMEGAARIESVLADLQLYGETVKPVMLPVQVEELVSALLAPISDEDRERIEIQVDASEGRRMLKADPYLVRQALLVLVQNALEATNRAGTARIEVTSADIPNHIQISVWNDGVIGVENAEHAVFVPFYTTKTHNLGVGLSIARRIAQLHNGSVDLTVNSVEDGVRFSLLLPVAR